MIKNKFNSQLLLKIIIIINIILVIIFLAFPIIKESMVSTTSGTEIYPVGLINEKDSYSQKINCKVDNVKKIATKFSTYGVNNNEGIINIKINNLNNNKQFEKSIELKKVEDNKDYELDFDEKICDGGENIDVTLAYQEYKKGNSLTLWKSKSKINNNYYINGNEQEGEIFIVSYGQSKDRTIIWYPLMIISVCSLIYCVSGDKNEK